MRCASTIMHPRKAPLEGPPGQHHDASAKGPLEKSTGQHDALARGKFLYGHGLSRPREGPAGRRALGA